MKTTIKVLDITLELSAKLIAQGVPFPNTDDKNQTIHNHFRVTVARTLDNGVVRKSFDFYGSQADHETGKTTLTEADLKDAFRCFVDDAISGSETFKEFCDNLGYDTDSRRAERVYKLCQKSYDKLLDLGFFERQLYDIVNKLNED